MYNKFTADDSLEIRSHSDQSIVSFQVNTDRREAVFRALKPFQAQVGKEIENKQVVIKVNAGMAAREYFLHSTHVDQIRGILDFLEKIYDRTVIVTEGAAGAMCSAFDGFLNYGYMQLEKEYNVKFIDANDQPYSLQSIGGSKHRPMEVNVVDMFLDPDIYMISAPRMKVHNKVVGTFSLKNVVMGAPVCHYKKKINEKQKMHGHSKESECRELNYNIYNLAKMGVQPDLSIIDGIVAIEGNGPWGGTPVEHGVTIASTDFVAADRLCAELMGIDPKYMKYLEWCALAGMGNFNMSDITVVGPDYLNYIHNYNLNDNFEKQVSWIDEYDNG